jgi:hypothetical protein
MNHAGATRLAPSAPRNSREEEGRVDRIYRDWMAGQWSDYQASSDGLAGDHMQKVLSDPADYKGHRLGYVTRDSCPGVGDDIQHIPGQSCICGCGCPAEFSVKFSPLFGRSAVSHSVITEGRSLTTLTEIFCPHLFQIKLGTINQ